MGKLGWIDFSKTHRERVQTVLDLLNEPGTVDELGIGSIRDAISDWLFPGLSTVQTRAKYFFIVPRIIRDYHVQYQNAKSPPPLADYLRKKELEVMQFLAEQNEFKEGLGIIGVTIAKQNDKHKQQNELVRRPSSIYWNGMLVHDIMNTHLSITQYLAKYSGQSITIKDILDSKNDDELKDDRDAHYRKNEVNVLFKHAPEQWISELTIELTAEEKDILKNKFLDATNPKTNENNLLKVIFQAEANGHSLAQLVLDADNFANFHYAAREQDYLPKATKKVMQQGYLFDRFIHGAHIIYNILLQEKSGNITKKKEFENEWEVWHNNLLADEVLEKLDLDFLFGISTRTKAYTQEFVWNWFEYLQKYSISNDISPLATLVRNQERLNKKAKARLLPSAHHSFDAWVGLKGLEYRFRTAKQIIEDIYTGE